ncbi:MAG: hypothetical protein KKB48_09660 [Gammaproteobacteria bacterium]|nr:hypothetical protein [Sideroxydans sp.]MBU3904508.1 hypothetical protein [Gammaproteobacteria bacterium]
MNLPYNLHRSRTLVVAFLFVLAAVLVVYRQEAKDVVRGIFEGGSLPYAIWIYVTVSVLSHSYFIAGVASSQFEKITETVFSIGTYGLAGTTSLTLLQGVFLQYFYGVSSFSNFGSLDLASVGLVSVYLLIYCGINTSRMLGDVVFQVKGSDAEPPEAT